MSFLKSYCPSCGEALEITLDVFKKGFISCGRCGAMFGANNPQAFSQDSAVRNAAPRYEVLRPALDLPKGLSIDPGEPWTLRRKWLSIGTWFLLFFAIMWNGFLVFWFSIALSEGAVEMALFGSLHVAVGLGIAYKVIADFVNTTLLIVSQGNLQVHHGPLPWPGGKTVPANDIVQLFCRRHVNRGNNGSSSTTYSIRWMDREGKEKVLLRSVGNSDQALYIEQELERRLGITDRPVEGAFTR